MRSRARTATASRVRPSSLSGKTTRRPAAVARWRTEATKFTPA